MSGLFKAEINALVARLHNSDIFGDELIRPVNDAIYVRFDGVDHRFKITVAHRGNGDRRLGLALIHPQGGVIDTHSVDYGRIDVNHALAAIEAFALVWLP
ncbi:hypothetical protein [Streptomyces sp. NPDC056308]|uniref:hypothetical protein n=1 Tax=Streptomyces sp. NPDC056308 TaxID=3345780 RepID=UPI0035DB5F50